MKQAVQENLICFSREGTELEEFDPTPAVVDWFNSGQRSRRPTFSYIKWPEELISVHES